MHDDYLEYRENLHALKGSATELGANKLADVCLEGERLKPYDMDSEKIRQMCLHIEEVFTQTVTAFNSAVSVENALFPNKNAERYNDIH